MQASALSITQHANESQSSRCGRVVHCSKTLCPSNFSCCLRQFPIWLCQAEDACVCSASLQAKSLYGIRPYVQHVYSSSIASAAGQRSHKFSGVHWCTLVFDLHAIPAANMMSYSCLHLNRKYLSATSLLSFLTVTVSTSSMPSSCEGRYHDSSCQIQQQPEFSILP